MSVPVCFNSTNNPWLEYSPFLFTDCFSKWETCDLYWESPAGQRYCLDSNWVLNKVTPVLEHFSEEYVSLEICLCIMQRATSGEETAIT